MIALVVAVAVPRAWGAGQDQNFRIADEHIVPAYQRLAVTTADLNEHAAAFCETPDAPDFDELRERFHEAMDAWQRIQHIRFGPVEFLMRNYRYQLWPDRRGSVGKHLRRLLAAQDATALEPERFASGSVAVQGFSALERLLFGSDVSNSDFAIWNDDPFRCAVVLAITHNLARMSSNLYRDWTRGVAPHRNFIATAAQGNLYYADERELLARLVNSLHTQLQVVSEQKLGGPLGDSRERSRPKKAESWRSDRSLRNVRLNLLETRDLYRVAFKPRIEDDALDRDVEAAFLRTLRAVDTIPIPLAQAVRDAAVRGKVETLYDGSISLKALFSGSLPQALGVPLGFNSLDGD